MISKYHELEIVTELYMNLQVWNQNDLLQLVYF